MKLVTVTVARIYITESSHLLNKMVDYLKDEAKIRGISVFRAISGFGDTGQIHSAKLVDLSLNLPLVVEFFDSKEKIMKALDYINSLVKPEHILFWEAQTNE
jgi:PII-like signaling protein